MIRITTLFLIGIIFSSACKRSSDDPCDGVICDYNARPPLYKFRLVDPATGHDLVYGPNAHIPLDSIKIQMSDTLSAVKQVIDTPHNTAVLIFYSNNPQTLRVGSAGKVTVDKLTVLSKPSGGCCAGTEIYGLSLNDNPASLKQDDAGVFLIPFAL